MAAIVAMPKRALLSERIVCAQAEEERGMRNIGAEGHAVSVTQVTMREATKQYVMRDVTGEAAAGKPQVFAKGAKSCATKARAETSSKKRSLYASRRLRVLKAFLQRACELARIKRRNRRTLQCFPK